MIYINRSVYKTKHESSIMPDRVELVGPFDSADAAANWASSNEHNPDDNPCWQLVNLDEPTFSICTP